MEVGYVCGRIKELCEELRFAVKRGDTEDAERLISKIQRVVEQFSSEVKGSNMDSVFLAGELQECAGERNVRYPHIEEYRRRRERRLYGVDN